MIYKMGELVSIIDGDRGKNYPKQDEFMDNGYCVFLDTGNVTKTGFSFENVHFITEEKCNVLRNGKMQKGDLAYTTRGTVGNVAYYNELIPYEHIRINSGMVILRANTEIVDASFLYQLLKHDKYRNYFKQYCTGSAQPQLPIKNFSQIELDVPQIEVQQKIGKILSTYDNLIANNRKQIKLLEEAVQRLYKEWFVDLRFPGYEGMEIVDGVPVGWKYKIVSDFGEVITGKTPSTSKDDYYGGNIPFVTIPDMHGNVYPLKTEKSLTKLGADTQKNKYLPKNSVIVSCIATVGLVNIAVESCQTNQQINSVILNNDDDLYFFYESMLRIKALLDGVGSNGATMTNVNKTKFSNIKVLYPTEDLVIKYRNFCSPIFEKILELSKAFIKLEQARDRLLPKLMNGEIEV